ncbi:MAG: agmatine deiminase family protein [Bacteroides sp.]|nr:agmatine deiminase family protein [Bacteroides sp.]
MTTNNISLRRLPAEWEPHEAVLLAWPHLDTDWAYMIDEARDCFADIISAISARERVIVVGPSGESRESFDARNFDPHAVTYIEMPTNDTWARDFGPITIEQIQASSGDSASTLSLDFKFNAWGMKFAADKDNLITRRLCDTAGSDGRSLLPPLINCQGFVLEGGSIESDGCGTLLTTAECLLSPNRNAQLSEQQIRDYLADQLGITHQLWLSHGALAGDDTDSHIDTLARLAPDDTILYVGAVTPEGDTIPELALMAEQLRGFLTPEGHPYNLIELPLPSPVYDENGEQLPATYANYLLGPTAVYLPVYSQPLPDRLAEMTLRVAYPDREIVPVDCRALIRQHGSLHCVTMQLPVCNL